VGWVVTTSDVGRPRAVFKDTALADRRMRQRAVLMSTTYEVLVTDEWMVDHKLTEWLAAEAEAICLMMRLRAGPLLPPLPPC